MFIVDIPDYPIQDQPVVMADETKDMRRNALRLLRPTRAKIEC